MYDSTTRRNILKLLPLAGLSALAPATARSQAPGSSARTLVAFFSRTGNTALVARQIRRARNATLFEIKVARPYPEDYDETVAQAARETRENYLPKLEYLVTDIRQYDEIYLGFPIWGMTAPPVIRSFLQGMTSQGRRSPPSSRTAAMVLAIALMWSARLHRDPTFVRHSRWKPIRNAGH